ncbi:MAG: hypothetical protein HXX13_13455 [Bacteroidetes bacterium]|nr:hypothetical protein [Bacteroidota bacterium]
MKKIIVLILLFPLISAAQDSKRFVQKGLLAGKGTLAAGKMTTYKATNMYVSGNLEYYLEDNISFRGGIYFFLGTSGAAHPFANNSSLFTGFFYHFNTHNFFDPYIGLEPGVSWTQLKKPDDPGSESYPYNKSSYPQSASPIASVTGGVNCYATNWTHLFIEAKYVHGVQVSDIPATFLDEIRFAFGFGFNINTIKKK